MSWTAGWHGRSSAGLFIAQFHPHSIPGNIQKKDKDKHEDNLGQKQRQFHPHSVPGNIQQKKTKTNKRQFRAKTNIISPTLSSRGVFSELMLIKS